MTSWAALGSNINPLLWPCSKSLTWRWTARRTYLPVMILPDRTSLQYCSAAVTVFTMISVICVIL